MSVTEEAIHTFIVSDLHVGSPYFKRQLFLDFLEALPANAALVLNGDTIDNPQQILTAKEAGVISALAELSLHQPVIWIEGNHDRDYQPEASGKIKFVPSYELPEKRLFVAHGSYFDNVMPRHRWFITLFRLLHTLRLKLGAPPVHVAEYAKKWGFLFRCLHRAVMMNAVEYAREHNFQAVACGHVHHTEHTVIDGIEYLNSGAWTERPTCYIACTGDDLALLEWESENPPTP
jgi:UDP-2,3-diacylglucosamine pyrophosphatase LpxH